MVCITMLAVGSLDISSNATPLLNTKAGFAFIPQQVEYARATSKSGQSAAYCYAPVDARGRIDFTQTKAVGTHASPMNLVNVRLQSHRFASAMARTDGFFSKPMTAADFCAHAQTHYAAQDVASLF